MLFTPTMPGKADSKQHWKIAEVIVDACINKKEMLRNSKSNAREMLRAMLKNARAIQSNAREMLKSF